MGKSALIRSTSRVGGGVTPDRSVRVGTVSRKRKQSKHFERGDRGGDAEEPGRAKSDPIAPRGGQRNSWRNGGLTPISLRYLRDSSAPSAFKNVFGPLSYAQA